MGLDDTIIQTRTQHAHDDWTAQHQVFVSQPVMKIVGNNGAGIYLLRSCTYRFIPKIYGMWRESFVECGISFAGWTLEFMWNKHFKWNGKNKP